MSRAAIDVRRPAPRGGEPVNKLRLARTARRVPLRLWAVRWRIGEV
jgi:hypothetical protein